MPVSKSQGLWIRKGWAGSGGQPQVGGFRRAAASTRRARGAAMRGRSAPTTGSTRLRGPLSPVGPPEPWVPPTSQLRERAGPKAFHGSHHPFTKAVTSLIWNVLLPCSLDNTPPTWAGEEPWSTLRLRSGSVQRLITFQV